jgi:hypothetical protein
MEKHLIKAAALRLARLAALKAPAVILLDQVDTLSRRIEHLCRDVEIDPDAYRSERMAALSIPTEPLTSEEEAELEREDREYDAAYEKARLCWIEPPYSALGKASDIYHYRLFCDHAWQPIKPRGEVYDRRNTPAEWKSFSDLHGALA